MIIFTIHVDKTSVLIYHYLRQKPPAWLSCGHEKERIMSMTLVVDVDPIHGDAYTLAAALLSLI